MSVDRDLECELNDAEAALHGDDCDCHDCWPVIDDAAGEAQDERWYGP